MIAPPFYGLHRAIRAGRVGTAVLSGGRGSTKSSFASVEVLLWLLHHPQAHAVVLRKVKNTLRTSVYAQLRWAADALGLTGYVDCSVSPMQMVYRPTGQTVFFFGLDDPGKLKSLKTPFGYVGVLWEEELDQFDGPEEIRNAEQSVLRGGPQALVLRSFNPPASPRSWVNRCAREEKAGQVVHRSAYLDVPRAWLGERFFEEAEHLRQTNELAYRHEYLGEVVGSGSAVFENIRQERLTDEQVAGFARVRRGVDWGYYPDPFAYNECCYDAARRTLYLFGELTARRLGNLQTAELVKARGRSEVITADSAEPKSVSDYRSFGLPCVAAKKGPGSVEHGMKWLQSLEAIVIDPVRCPDTLREFLEYEYGRDRDGEVTGGYPDMGNHHIDAVRYAMEGVSAQRVARVSNR